VVLRDCLSAALTAGLSESEVCLLLDSLSLMLPNNDLPMMTRKRRKVRSGRENRKGIWAFVAQLHRLCDASPMD
jgi:hypothetical protein